jgi:hypothetical protein
VKSLPNGYAKIGEKINDLYVFINSLPANNYEIIETVKGDNLIDTWNSLGIGKEKAEKVISNIINAGKDNLVFYEMLFKITERVHNNYSQASGVIFTNNMKECQVVKFK